MNTLILIGAIIIGLFLSYVVINFGVLSSISESFYRIKNNWLFSAVLIAFSLCILAFAIIYTDSILLIIAPFGIITVALAPRFKDKHKAWIHFTGAAVGIGSGLLAIWLYYGLWWIDVIAIVLYLAVKISKSNNSLWWGEIIAIFAIISGLLLGCISKKNKSK